MNRPARMNPVEFDNIAATEQSFWWYRGMDRMLWNFLDSGSTVFQGGQALELGCGTGWVSSQFRSRYPDCPLTSMDLAPEGLRYAKGRGLSALVQGDIRELPFEANRFRLVFLLDVIVHLEPGEEENAFAEISRVLAPGGLLVLRAAAWDWLRSRHSAFVNERQRFRRSTLLPVIKRNGMAPVRSTYANTLLLPVALLKFRVWEPLVNAPSDSGLNTISPILNGLLENVLRAEAAFLRSGGQFPVGQSLWVVARKPEEAG